MPRGQRTSLWVFALEGDNQFCLPVTHNLYIIRDSRKGDFAQAKSIFIDSVCKIRKKVEIAPNMVQSNEMLRSPEKVSLRVIGSLYGHHKSKSGS
ncbi:hypothetical protein HMPREF1651_08415 [Prevotella bivia DNF00188]|nr:hypothetical protein HMPREF1651_08415 [Prevotella bivia DNF00188]